MTILSSTADSSTPSPPRRNLILGIRPRYWRIGFITAVTYAIALVLIGLVKTSGSSGRYASAVLAGLLLGAAMAAMFAYFEKKALARLRIDADSAYDQDIFAPTQSNTFTVACSRDEALQRASDALAEYGAVIDKRDDAAGRVEAVTFQNWRSYGERLTISVIGNGPCEVNIGAVSRIYALRLFSNYGRSWEHVHTLTTRILTGAFALSPSRGDIRMETSPEVSCTPPAVMEAGAWQRLITVSILYALILLGLTQPGKVGLVFGAFALGLTIELIAFLKFRNDVRSKRRSESQETIEVMLNNIWPAIFAPVLTIDPRQSWSEGSNIAAMVIFVAFSLIAVSRLREKKRERAQRVLLHASREKAELERQLAEAKLVALSAQIEPHFLFNTLASIQYLIGNDASKAAEMTGDLIRYLRLALPRMRQSTARLADELELVRAYLGIMQIRMGLRLRFAIESPDELGEVQIPTMALITLVENAIKHGLEQKSNGGVINVTVVRDPSDARNLRIEVADTGGGFSTAASGTGIGLANIRERLTTLYGSRAQLSLEANQPSGLKAILISPMERK